MKIFRRKRKGKTKGKLKGIFHRIKRLFEAIYNIPVDDVSSFGSEGEELAKKELVKVDNKYFNRIVPHPDKSGHFLETDIIVYAGGSLFCIEIKNYKGTITYLPGTDKRRIKVEKEGNYGEGIFTKEFANPMGKTLYFIRNVKSFLSKRDQRFSNLYFLPVVAFSDYYSDISAINSMDDGIIYISEIQRYISQNKNGKFANNQGQWIIKGLKELPTWDRIITRTGEEHYGIFSSQNFSFTTTAGKEYSIPYENILEVKISRDGMFSDRDSIEILTNNNARHRLDAKQGFVVLNKFGQIQKHRLRNIDQIIIGTQVLRS